MDNNLINTRKCVSYLTQTKEYIPIEYRKVMGNQIFGCDICQINCPKNHKILNQASDENYDSLLVDLEELFRISNKEFALKYGNISGSWRGKNIWKRNAIISSANMELYNFYDLIKDELYGTSEMFKIYASWALLKLNVQKSKDLIYNRIKYENETIRDEYNKLLNLH
jgi:epoxyqueuosine reductase